MPQSSVMSRMVILSSGFFSIIFFSDASSAFLVMLVIGSLLRQTWLRPLYHKPPRRAIARSAMPAPLALRTPNKTEKRSKRQQGRKKPNGYHLCVHVWRGGVCIDVNRKRFAQQSSGAFKDERNCPPHVWQCGALYVSLCTPVCKTESRTLYQREVSEDDKWVSRANFAG